jgi:hypothetical protein
LCRLTWHIFRIDTPAALVRKPERKDGAAKLATD